jgi:hypothetical protein
MQVECQAQNGFVLVAWLSIRWWFSATWLAFATARSLAFAELAEVFRDRIGVARRHSFGAGRAHLARLFFVELAAQFEFDAFKRRHQLADALGHFCVACARQIHALELLQELADVFAKFAVDALQGRTQAIEFARGFAGGFGAAGASAAETRLVAVARARCLRARLLRRRLLL